GVLRHESAGLRSRWISAVRGTQKLRFHCKKLTHAGRREAMLYLSARVQTVANRLRRSVLDRCARDLLDSQALLTIAVKQYRPEPYAGRIVHTWAMDRSKGRFRGLAYEWGGVGNGNMRFYESPGNHVTMFQGQNGRALGQLLGTCLNEIEGSSAAL